MKSTTIELNRNLMENQDMKVELFAMRNELLDVGQGLQELREEIGYATKALSKSQKMREEMNEMREELSRTREALTDLREAILILNKALKKNLGKSN